MNTIKEFNISGPCSPSEHYMLPVLPRLPGVEKMIDKKNYFILHSPRQSGKTTFVKTMVSKINSDGNYYALYCSLSTLRTVEAKKEAMDTIADLINVALKKSNIPPLKALAYPDDAIPESGEAVKIGIMLNRLSVSLDRDLVVFFDEADCLTGPPLLTFLSQIRDGFIDRFDSPESKFPRSLALVGLRNIRDYITSSLPGAKQSHLASPFNIVAERFTLANFTRTETGALYRQHTEAAGQVFTDQAVERAWHWTEGQPWLVNALAHEIVNRQPIENYSKTITETDFDRAAQTLIKRQDTHLDSLENRLSEPRIRRVMEAIVASADSFPTEISDDDIRYTLELGLLKEGPSEGQTYQPANPIYQEVILRALTSKLQASIPTEYILKAKQWMDGTKLDMNGLLKSFQTYWRENCRIASEKYIKDSRLATSINNALKKHEIDDKDGIVFKDLYKGIKKSLKTVADEASALLVLYAFLQRALNGGADFLQREYALGRLRSDICVSYLGRRYPVELKIKYRLSLEKSMEQISGYMDRCGAAEGWLVVFDRNFKKPWQEKITWETKIYKALTIHVVGC
jgi:hypothetical protein